jgi:hypothetical protein
MAAPVRLGDNNTTRSYQLVSRLFVMTISRTRVDYSIPVVARWFGFLLHVGGAG